MIGNLPGTSVEVELSAGADEFMSSLFMGGGLVLSQVTQLTGLAPHTVQNWVKRGYVSPPSHKKYNEEQFCTMAILNALHDVFTLEQIRDMLQFVGGAHPCPAQLIFKSFSKTLGALPSDSISAETKLDPIITGAARPYGLSAEAERRLCKVLQIMTLAHLSAQLMQQARLLQGALD